MGSSWKWQPKTSKKHRLLLYCLYLFLDKTQFIRTSNVLWICQQWRHLLNNKRVFTNETYSHILTSYTASIHQFLQNSLMDSYFSNACKKLATEFITKNL